NAMAAAQWILVPIEAANFAIAGLSDFLNWVEVMRQEGVHDAQLLGLLPTKFEERTRISGEMRKLLGGAGLEILPAVPKRVGIEDLVAVRAVADRRRLPEVAEAYQHAVAHVMRVVENGQAVAAR